MKTDCREEANVSVTQVALDLDPEQNCQFLVKYGDGPFAVVNN